MTDRDKMVAELEELDSWTLAEMIVDLEDKVRELENQDMTIPRLKSKITSLENEVFVSRGNLELDPSRLESALRMYVAELDYDIHKGIQNSEEDGLDRYSEEVDFFLRCWETAGEN